MKCCADADFRRIYRTDNLHHEKMPFKMGMVWAARLQTTTHKKGSRWYAPPAFSVKSYGS